MNYLIIGGELYHHGIKGQKWGVRRWQNADGTFNEAGKKRYFSDNESNGPKSSLKGTLHRNMAGVYELNEKYYSKHGNKTLASMNKAAKEQFMKKAAEADKAHAEKVVAKKTAKFDKDINKMTKEKEKTLAAREKNKAKLEERWAKKEEAGKMTKTEVKAAKKDFDVGTKAVKQGYDRYISTVSNYKNMKASSIMNPSSKKTQDYIDAGKAYRKQANSNAWYGKSGTVLLYSGEAADRLLSK